MKRTTKFSFMKLKDIAIYVKDRVEIEKLSLHNYISTENMLPEKGGVQTASSLPSISMTSGFRKDDILTSNIRPYFKKIWIANKEGGCSNDVLVLRAKNNCHPKFLYYVLSENRFFDYSTASAKGTKMPRGDKSAIMEYKVPDYCVPEQIQIADILSSLDDKIAFNKRINDNLEQQIQVIFNHYFTNEPYDCLLGDVVKTTSGGTPSRKIEDIYYNGSIPWVKSKELNGTFLFDTEEHITELGVNNSSAKLLPKNSVLIAMYGATVGEYAIISKTICCNQAVCALIPNDKIPYSYLLMIAKNRKYELINMAVGSAQQNISQVLVKNLPISSNYEIIANFNNATMSIFKEIKNNSSEIVKLMSIRDLLLPKLMSGELKINEMNN